ncbi:OmpA family protein [Acetobacteraceae bacterium KSS8]|uniref:OmpA family protein n=1 Tax=Endosaccharibacter trunci TaxID=2812733 RepID=A0ABT1W468_9PROT|nr:OmpA family protein [Acetobacteraceae bacterium KSS8]
MAKRRGKGEGGTVVVKREEIIAGGHHGGAWKVAYADFVTAMMAFFLLMWLLNATTEQQRRGIAAYFSPLANVENGYSGTGLVPGGVTPLDNGTELTAKPDSAPKVMIIGAPARAPMPNSNADHMVPAPDNSQAADAPAILNGGGPVLTDPDASSDDSGEDGRGGAMSRTDPETPAEADSPEGQARKASGALADAAAREQRTLQNAAAALTRSIASDPSLAGSAGQMAIDVTREGLRIQIMDRDQQPMFARGGVALNERAVALLRKVAPFLARLPEPVSIGGYTDGAPWPPGPVTNWSLSSGRANAARDVLVSAGLPDGRITDVSGYADRHLLLPAQPMADANRRIVLTLHRLQALPPATAQSAAQAASIAPVDAAANAAGGN